MPLQIFTLPRVQKGDPWRAKDVNRIHEILENNRRAIVNLNGVVNGSDDGLEDARRDSEASGGGFFTNGTFTETARTSTDVTVTDSDSDTHTDKRVTQVTLQNANGETLVLNLTPPTS